LDKVAVLQKGKSRPPRLRSRTSSND
jgi:hypothetical protein